MDTKERKTWTVANCPIERPCSQTREDPEHDDRYPRIGYYTHCKTNVYRCDSEDELETNAALGRCIALPVRVMTIGSPRYYLGGPIASLNEGDKLSRD